MDDRRKIILLQFKVSQTIVDADVVLNPRTCVSETPVGGPPARIADQQESAIIIVT
jgi:hypothetical protein